MDEDPVEEVKVGDRKRREALPHWVCSRCTFENTSGGRECEICEAQFDLLANRMAGNTKEARRFFEANGFSFYPDAVPSGSDREDIQRSFFSVFNDAEDNTGGRGMARRSGRPIPFEGKGYREGNLQSSSFHREALKQWQEGAGSSSSSSDHSKKDWEREGADKYKNSIKEGWPCWHTGSHEDINVPDADLRPTPEFKPLYDAVLKLVREKVEPPPSSSLDALVADRLTLYLVQVIQYKRESGGSQTRGMHIDDVTNAGHLIVGYTNGPQSRFLTLLCRAEDKEYTYELTPGSVYIMKDAARYGNKLLSDEHDEHGYPKIMNGYPKIMHEPYSLAGHTSDAMVFRFGTIPRGAKQLDMSRT